MSPSSTTNSARTLPAAWYREPAFYELERRAIFAQSWVLISHSLQFEKPGHYVRYEIAGYPFFIIKDRKGNINALLNVCRHRAFPLVLEDSGQASILACKYHGECASIVTPCSIRRALLIRLDQGGPMDSMETSPRPLASMRWTDSTRMIIRCTESTCTSTSVASSGSIWTARRSRESRGTTSSREWTLRLASRVSI